MLGESRNPPLVSVVDLDSPLTGRWVEEEGVVLFPLACPSCLAPQWGLLSLDSRGGVAPPGRGDGGRKEREKAVESVSSSRSS